MLSVLQICQATNSTANSSMLYSATKPLLTGLKRPVCGRYANNLNSNADRKKDTYHSFHSQCNILKWNWFPHSANHEGLTEIYSYFASVCPRGLWDHLHTHKHSKRRTFPRFEDLFTKVFQRAILKLYKAVVTAPATEPDIHRPFRTQSCKSTRSISNPDFSNPPSIFISHYVFSYYYQRKKIHDSSHRTSGNNTSFRIHPHPLSKPTSQFADAKKPAVRLHK